MSAQYVTAIFILLWVGSASSIKVPQNPCPNVFTYYKNSQGNYYGEANIPYDGNQRLTFSVNASFATLFKNKNLKLELANPPRDPTSVRTLKYYIYFPFSNILPKITQIMYNDRVYCSGPEEPLIPGGTGVTNVWSAHMYQYYSAYPSNNNIPVYEPPVHVDSNENDNSDDNIPVKDPETNTVQGLGISGIQYTTEKPTLKPITTSTNAPVTMPSTTQHVDIDYDIFKPDPDNPSLDLTPIDIRGTQDIQCGVPTSGGVIPLILGGSKSEQGQYPWLAAMFRYNRNIYEYRCTVNLISQKHVITAAHCIGQYFKVQLIKTEDILVVMGTNDLDRWATNGAITRGASKVTVNPGFKENSKSSDSDLAIITLDKIVAYTNQVKPICLWNTKDSIEPLVAKKGLIAGWGTIDEGGKEHVSVSHHVEMPIVSQFDCLKADPAFRNITSENTFCAGDKSGNGPCVGDSGAGFVIPMYGAYYLRGISSIAITENGRCALREKYAVFCDVAKYKSWIETVMTS